MIRIVGKGYKYILIQLKDFYGTVDEITISLKSEIGNKEYTKLIGGKIAIWDRRLFERNGMKFKETGMFSDPDAGPDSHKSNKVVIDHRVITIIAARANSVGEFLKTDSGNHFRGKYIPRMYHRLLGKLYNLRTIVERKNSNEVVGHHRSKMSNCGIEQSRIFVSIPNITALLTALTAFKIGRLDLIRSPSVFRMLAI